MGHVWIFQQDSNPKTSCKIKTKMGHWAQNQAFAMAIPVPRPEPYRKWVGWTEEKKHQHRSGNLKDLERFCIEEWSLISCQVFSKFIKHYKRRLRAVILEKGGCKKNLIKVGKLFFPMCFGEKHLFHNVIPSPPNFHLFYFNKRLDFFFFFFLH